MYSPTELNPVTRIEVQAADQSLAQSPQNSCFQPNCEPIKSIFELSKFTGELVNLRRNLTSQHLARQTEVQMSGASFRGPCSCCDAPPLPGLPKILDESIRHFNVSAPNELKCSYKQVEKDLNNVLSQFRGHHAILGTIQKIMDVIKKIDGQYSVKSGNNP